MTHEELLDKIEDLDYYQEYFANKTFLKAVLAVAELHKPWETLSQLENPLVWCEACEEDYPCLTIQAIEKELA